MFIGLRDNILCFHHYLALMENYFTYSEIIGVGVFLGIL